MGKIWRSPWYPRVVFVLCALPFLLLVWKWRNHQLGINSVEYVARYLGIWTLRLLLIGLAITPLRRIPGLTGLIKVRRMVGLFTFFYGFLHGLHYFWIDVGWNKQVILEDLTFRRFFIAGFVALLLMVPLAATSFNAAIRWMGGRRWQWLHRLVYVSAVLGVIHYAWQGKGIALKPVYYGLIMLVLLLARVGISISKRLYTGGERATVPST